MNRWVGILAAVASGLILTWSWQAVQEQQRLTGELTDFRETIIQLRTEKVQLTKQLKLTEIELEQNRIVQIDFEEAMARLQQQVTEAASARAALEAQLQAIQEQETFWGQEKAQLEQRIAQLQSELDGVTQITHTPRSPVDMSTRAETIVPPTGEQPAGNGGFLVRKRPQPEADGDRQVDVRPDEPAERPWTVQTFPWQ